MSGIEDDLTGVPDRARRGDEEAARLLVDRCTPLVLAICRAHRPRHLAVEDLAQEVFTVMFARLDRYEERPGVPFAAWLSKLAVNACLDVLRAESRRPRMVAGEATFAGLAADPEPDPSEARTLVDALLAELAPADRLVLALLDLEERSVAEIAELTGWSRTGTKVRAFRARLRLKAIAEDWRKRGRL